MLTKYFLEKSWEDQYYLMSAMRGSDDLNPDFLILKDLITTRIRYIVLDLACKQPFFNYEVNIFTDHDLENLVNTMPKLIFSHHYVIHLYQAICVCKDHEIWGGLGNQIRQTLLTRC